MPKKMTGKCCICGKPVFSPRSIYCRPHSHFSARMSDERFSPKTREALWKYVRKHGFTCFYTGQEGLDVFDKSSPYFLEFDHVIPGDPRRIVITSAWFNEMKGDLSIREFKRSNVQLYNYWTKGIKIKKMNFRYWFRLIEKIRRK
jgi:hypothetical protein